MEAIAKDIANLVDARMKIGFYDQLVESNMETTEYLVMDGLVDFVGDLNVVEHLVMDDPVAIGGDVGGDFYIAENLVVDDPVAIGGELCIAEHLVVSNEIAGLACIDGDLHIGADAGFFSTGVDSLVSNVDERFLLKHYVQFVLGSEHGDWTVDTREFDRVMNMWKICMVVFLSLLRWKLLVKMKMMVDLSFGVKVWDTLF